ncbi:MAG: hypothetical protein ACR2G5_04965 [Pyrinomonadaceae bacterium]
MDKTHRYARSKPEGRANVHKARDGSEMDDTAFDLARSYKMALATFHRTGGDG